MINNVKDIEIAKNEVCEYIDSISEELISVSHSIHENPELCYEEHFAHDLLTGVLIEKGLDVEKNAYGIETAFKSETGNTGPVVAVLCEYDALPGIGHGCGHNIIAASGLGAGLATSSLAERLGGQIRILGTPAEEGGGGKVKMLREGAFDKVSATLMVHPADCDLTGISSLAVQQLKASYTGKASHAAAAPEKGVNALDGAVLGYMAVAALRQHISQDQRLHGIFTDGGQKANIVPEYAEATWYARAATSEDLQVLKKRLVAALEGAAKSAGCSMNIEWVGEPYSEVVDNEPLLGAYVKNSERLGRSVALPDLNKVVGSTDLGNVSQMMPSIHPMIKAAPTGTAIHTKTFANSAISKEGDKAVLDAAKILAMTVIDCWCSEQLLKKADAFFNR